MLDYEQSLSRLSVARDSKETGEKKFDAQNLEDKKCGYNSERGTSRSLSEYLTVREMKRINDFVLP